MTEPESKESFKRRSLSVAEAVDDLLRAGMQREQLQEIHHNARRRETFSKAANYLRETRPRAHNNIRYHARLMYIASQHWETSLPFDRLVSNALRIFPK